MAAADIRSDIHFKLIIITGCLALTLCALPASVALAQPPVYGYEIVTRYPHAADAFTQGLVYEGERLYESTGLFDSSSLREVDLETGAVLRRVDLQSQFFAEGMTLFQGKIIQLTWQNQVGFIYDPATFARIGEFSYTGEGWGLTHDAQHLIMSDGTNRIRFLDPATFQVVRSIDVWDSLGNPLNNINELEYINGEIYANVWQTDRVARIDPFTGAIIAWIDLTGLRTSGDVLNGIAYDAATGHLLVTGKLWPWMYRIEVDTGAAATPEITAPTQGATLSGTQVFEWSSGTGVTRYWLYVGSTQGGNDLYNQDRGSSLAATVAGLPSDGRTLYARLWWMEGGGWEFADFTYTAPSGGTNPQITVPAITYPAPGAALTGPAQVFQWSPGTGASNYWLYVGSSQGAADLHNQDLGTSLSASVSGLPIDGRTLYARLWWLRAGSWEFADFTFHAAGG
jgi:glutamine cyclotransferase